MCSKIMEHVIYSSMFEHLNRHEQHGFWQHRSCEIQLIITVNDFAQCLNQQAFDKVPHSGLFHKLQFYGIEGPLLTWIKNFLSDRSQEVVLNNKQGDSCNAGVPQGTVLAPLLF